jgi:5'-deoxynucleotidase YfbR-like HD superfamily hydrolase
MEGDKMTIETQTYTGRTINLFKITADDIDLDEIAHALSNICRFGGQVQQFFSVAQHSVLVSEMVSDENKKWALLHDASEAYIQDIIRPLKHSGLFNEYLILEDIVMNVICDKFELNHEQPNEVTLADKEMLEIEKQNLRGTNDKPDTLLYPLSPKVSKFYFLEYARLLGIYNG